MDDIKVEDKLRQYVEKHNITVKDLSRLIGKNRNTVTSIIKGESAIDANGLFMIIKEYGIPFSYFFPTLEDEVLALNDKIDALEFYLSSVLLSSNDNSADEIPLSASLYEFPQIVKLSQQYGLYKTLRDQRKNKSHGII